MAIWVVLLLAVPCQALTTVTVNKGGGADYTSLSAAEAALPDPLTDDYRISCEGATDDTTAPTIDVATLNGGTQYTLEIFGDAASGIFDDAKYQIKVGQGASGLTIATNYVTVHHLQISGDPTGTFSINGISVGANNSHITIHDCLIRDFQRVGTYGAILGNGGTGTAKLFYNNIISNCNDGIYLRQNFYGDAYNNTVSGCGRYGLRVDCETGKVINLKNNLIESSATADYYVDGTGGTLTTAKNFTADGTSPDAGCSSATITFVGGEDFHLDGSMNQTMRGVSLAGTFTTDIDGDTRAWWDPGADEMSDPPTGPTIQQTWWSRRRQ